MAIREADARKCSVKSCLKKFPKIHTKALAIESITGLLTRILRNLSQELFAVEHVLLIQFY